MDPTDERWQRADEILDAALDLPLGERSTFLDRSSGGDAELRALVERLLAGAETDASAFTPGGALRGPLWDDLAGDEDALSGATLGRYRILREVGRGGMAVVYLAERADGQFRQQVAVKVLKRGLDTDEVVRRFDQERQILALARHPGLARLLDGGVEPGGRPYFVMEYVEGRPIDQHCDDERLAVPDRLRLFLQVARAVEAAHRNLVVHRDIKPSNILITADGHAKLLDFGIAKLLDPGAAQLTRTVARLMTPAYASPEQVRGEPVTTASDVYQLGLLLYLLLAGRFPYSVGGGAGAAARAIAADEPTRPSTAATGPAERGVPPGQEPRPAEAVARARATSPKRLRRALSGDLDTIVLTALRKEPERRYGSVAQLIDDVERHLAGRPVSARPDTLVYRTGKLVRRHAAAAVTAAGALALVVALTVGYTLELARQRDRARLAALRSTQVSDFLRGLFEVAAPTRSLGEQITARQLLDRGAARIDGELAGQPEIQADLMTLMGDVYRELALYDEAQALSGRAVALRRRFPGEDGLELAAALHHFARALADRAEHAAARRLYEEALALRERALGPDHADVARTLGGLGRVLAAQGEFPAALRHQERALAVLEASLGPRHSEVGLALKDLGALLAEGLDSPDARPRLERAVEILTASHGPDHPHVAEARVHLGKALSSFGHHDAARLQYESALPVLERSYGSAHPVLANVLHTLGNLLIVPGLERKDPDGAIAYFRRALAIREAALGPLNPEVGDTLDGLGRAFRLKGDRESSRTYLERSLALTEAALGPEHVDLATTLFHLASVYQETGLPQQALRLYERALRIREKVYGPEHESFTLPLYNMARIERGLGNPAACEAHLRRILGLHAGAENEHGLAMIYIDLGRCLTDQGRLEEAEKHVSRFTAEGIEPETRRRAREAMAEIEKAR